MLPYAADFLDQWAESSYGVGGFWQSALPRNHFRTAAAGTRQFADAVLAQLARQDELDTVIDVGAGGGELLARVATARRDLRCVGLDLRGRPDRLPTRVEWCRDLWEVREGGFTTGAAERLFAGLRSPVLLICAEWLDDLPCRPVGAATHGWSADDAADVAWLETWWPWLPGRSTAEVGRTRDAAWAWLVTALHRAGGVALAIDYGHLRADRPAGGSLAAYRDGRAVLEAAAGANVTAAVAMDAVAAAGLRAGAATVRLARQAEVVRQESRDEAGDPLDRLVRASERAALTSARVWGDQWWLVQEVRAG